MNDQARQAKENKWTKRDWILLAINAFIFAALFIAYNDRLPERVTSHYNVSGEADRTMTKASFWLLYGAIGTILPSLMTLIRQIDPRKQNYARFNSYYYLMRYAISVFLHGIFLLVILDNLDYEVPMINMILGGIGLLWIVVGNGMSQLRSNFFMGIRTPWTLTDEDNWRRTHRVGARLWVLAGLLMLIGALTLPRIGLVIDLIVAIALSIVAPIAYSFLLYRRKHKEIDPPGAKS